MNPTALSLAAAWLIVGVTTVTQTAIVFGFDQDKAGTPPAGFTFAAMRQPAPGAWLVRRMGPTDISHTIQTRRPRATRWPCSTVRRKATSRSPSAFGLPAAGERAASSGTTWTTSTTTRRCWISRAARSPCTAWPRAIAPHGVRGRPRARSRGVAHDEGVAHRPLDARLAWRHPGLRGLASRQGRAPARAASASLPQATRTCGSTTSGSTLRGTDDASSGRRG